MLGSLLLLFALIAFAGAVIGGVFLGLGGILSVLQESWSAFHAGFKGESVAK